MLAGVLALYGCGGGGDDDRCSSQSSLAVTVKWNTNGTISNEVVGKAGVPLTATPVITGVPESCKSSLHFSVVGGGELLAGFSLNSDTGVISGTSAKNSGGAYGPLVDMTVKGYSTITVLTAIRLSQEKQLQAPRGTHGLITYGVKSLLGKRPGIPS